MKARRRQARKVTKADMLRCIRHLTRATRKPTDAFHLLRIDVQVSIAQAKKDER